MSREKNPGQKQETTGKDEDQKSLIACARIVMKQNTL